MVLTDPERFSPERYERFARTIMQLIWAGADHGGLVQRVNATPTETRRGPASWVPVADRCRVVAHGRVGRASGGSLATC